MLAEHRHLVEQGAKLVELRLDFVNRPVNIRRLLADRPGPVVVSCRRPEDGGKWAGTEEQRMLLLRTAIAEGVEYVDLEVDVAPSVPRFGKTQRIVSFHNFRKMPDDLEALHARLVGCDADIVKIAAMANHPGDNVRILNLVRKAKVPTIGLAMGDIGVPTRILAGKFGTPFSYATFRLDRTMAPGQLSYDDMSQIYRYEQINADTEVYGVVGDPIGHSLSPMIHNASFAHLGMNRVYIPFRVPREDLAQFLDEAEALGIRGLSVTIPHKEETVKKLTAADIAVRGIGAANTVVFSGLARNGYNTDYHAAMSSLEDAMNVSPTAETPFAGKTALVMGCGGAGMAITYGLVRRGAHVLLSDIAARRSEQMAKRFGCVAIDWADRHKAKADILVNCTPVGMHPNVDETPFEKHYLHPSTLVFDVVYNPENTLLIKDARSRACTVVTGVEMFVRQACLQFKLFTGQEGPGALMRKWCAR